MNKLTKIFDNIGFNFNIKNNNFVVGEALKGYNSLNATHVNYYVPYLVRNYLDNNTIEYEVGVGYIKLENSSIIVERYQVAKSSNNNEIVNFKNSNRKEFYIFANETNFNSGFNNVLIKDSSFNIEPIQASYLVDSSSDTIEVSLPQNTKSDNIIVEIKLVGGNNPIIIRDYDGHILLSLNSSKTYSRLTCKNNKWYELIPSSSENFSSLSVDEPSFGILSNPVGSTYSFQYNNGSNTFGSSNLYWSSGNTNKLLLGSDVESSAHSIIPTSGSYPTIFNNDSKNSDFIVNGSGTKNMFFAYDGRLGLNIPSGSRPLTILHVVNTICQEGFRLENRNSCHPANMTLYHLPSGSLTNGNIVAEINLAGKDSNSNRVNYAQVQSRAMDWTAASPKGQFDVTVASTSTGIRTILSNPDYTTIGYSTNNIKINSAGNTTIGHSGSLITAASNAISVSSPNIQLQSTLITLGSGGNGAVNVPSLYATSIQSNSIKIPNIAANSILAIDSSGYISAGSNVVKFSSIPSGRILTTSTDGSITGVFSTDSYFLTEQDLTWNKYPKRLSNICLRQVVPIEPVPVEEYNVGDQIAIITESTTFYRDIVSLDIENNLIVGILVNQTLTENTVTNVNIYSITRGGYLLMQMHTEEGTTPDATSNTLSIRPYTDTVFNSQQKDINFIIYGTETVPTLSVKSNNGRLVEQSGSYNTYATTSNCQNVAPFAIPVTSDGQGSSNTNNTVNYNLTALGSFSGMVTSVGTNGLPSYYGTYDQNGNAAEWIEDSNYISTSVNQFVAGGAWNTSSSNGLRSLISVNYSGSYDYVGFRICGAYGLSDNSYISGNLNLSFMPVGSPYNPADASTLYTSGVSGLVATGINNLGVTDQNYRIGKYEVTNSQYAKFLNAVAVTNPYGLYDSNMTSSVIGGITQSGTYGSYSYYTKTKMEDKPAVFVDYLSAIRFTNWLHNGAPTGSVATGTNITEDGSYYILSLGPNSYQVTKNTYQKYWLPSVHEWHKAAYYEPSPVVSSSGASSVLIRTDEPYMVSSGTISGVPYVEYASLSVSGTIYADKIIGGDNLINSVSPNKLSLVNGTLIIESGSHKITIGVPNNLTLNTGNTLIDGTYGNYIATTGIELSANGDITLAAGGNIELLSPNLIKLSGISAQTIKYQNLQRIDSNNSLIPLYSGSNGSILYKVDDYTATGANQFRFINGLLNMPGGTAYNPLYLDDNKYVIPYTGVRYLPTEVIITKDVSVDKIKIGPEYPYYQGSILTHAGAGYATWEPADYLNAEGVLWSRYPKRLVHVYQDRLVFIDDGITTETLNQEFSYTDTIALINIQTREPYFVKAADGYFVVDGETNPPLSKEIIVSGGDGPEITFCPSSPWALTSGVPVSGYAYAVNRGGYLTMQIDSSAISGFDCGIGIVDNDASLYSFKPSTLNRISIRPDTHTAFNMLAENIDFIVYGKISTPYNRYQPELFDLDNNGLPTGLIPGFKIDANVPNAVSGILNSGVIYSGYLDASGTIPSGYHIDETAKVYINTSSAYVIDSITSGTSTLDYVADLTVAGNAYISGLITEDIYLKPIPTLDGSGKYIVNAPLTVNTYGKIISQVPEAAPTAPGSPTSLTGIPGNAAVTLGWIAPTNNGGRVVTNYKVEYSANSGSSWTTYSKPVSTDTSISLTGLSNGISYIFRVSAINGVGTGSPSIVSGSITPSSSRPSIVRELDLTRGNLSVSLSWTVPEFGSPFTGYSIDYSINGGLTWTTYSNPTISNNGDSNHKITTLSGLLNEPRYLFRIKAQNSSGYGAYETIDSIGTDPYEPPADDGDSTNIWDFGKIVFTGVCS
jgi:hypothetical protein